MYFPAFGKVIAKPFLPTKADDRAFREGFMIGQTMSTPDDLERKDIIEEDVPYAAFLGFTNQWIAFNDKRFTGQRPCRPPCS